MSCLLATFASHLTGGLSLFGYICSVLQLVLVLEYAAGVELFDAILSKTKFSEDEARPVFVQASQHETI